MQDISITISRVSSDLYKQNDNLGGLTLVLKFGCPHETLQCSFKALVRGGDSDSLEQS